MTTSFVAPSVAPPSVGISSAARSSIGEALAELECRERVRILYACESGSRAWGFASPTSDYDVRFVYARPRETYLSLDSPRDTIERALTVSPSSRAEEAGGGEEAAQPIPTPPTPPTTGFPLPLDMVGWDLFKALRLLRKSNPPLIEWLFSPLIYREYAPFCASVRAAARQYYAPSVLISAYEHMARGNYNQYIRGKPRPLLKKYLYVLRPLAQVSYMKQCAGQLPPVSFRETLGAIILPAPVYREITDLLLLKMRGEEMGQGPARAALNEWIEARLAERNEEEYDPARRESFSDVLEGILAETLVSDHDAG